MFICNASVKLGEDGRLPERKHAGDAGYDMYVAEEVVIPPLQYRDVPTHISVALQSGFCARIVGRSSTWRKRKLFVMEGIIDNGYRGEMFIGVFNFSNEIVTINKHDRIAQLIVIPQVYVQMHDCTEYGLPTSTDGRNERGFGSTGK